MDATARTCHGCGQPLAPTEVFHRFHVVLEGDQDLDAVLAAEGAEPPQALAERLDRDGSWEAYEDGVHWEFSGVLCSPCRKAFRTLLSAFSKEEPT